MGFLSLRKSSRSLSAGGHRSLFDGTFGSGFLFPGGFGFSGRLFHDFSMLVLYNNYEKNITKLYIKTRFNSQIKFSIARSILPFLTST